MKHWCLTFCIVVASLFGSVGVGFALSPCPSDPNVPWHNCFGTYIFSNGNKYVGEWRNNVRAGEGILYHRNGTVSEGIWAANDFVKAKKTTYSRPASFLRNAFIKLSKGERERIQKNLASMGYYKSSIDGLYGKGTASALLDYNTVKLHNSNLKKSANVNLLFAILSLNAEIFRKFSSNLPPCPDHQQVKSYNNCLGSFFEGPLKLIAEYKNGKPSGLGFLAINGNSIFGQFLDGGVVYGTQTNGDGSKYVGEFKDGKRHGQGTVTFASGVKYVGEFKDDTFNGQGTVTYASGDKYVGEYKDDKFNGQGTYTSANGDKYIGEFKDNKRHGQGTLTWATGDEYVGKYKDGQKHGQGTFTGVDGFKYVGEFKDDKFNGEGTANYADGTVEEGIWKDSEFQYAKKISPPVSVEKTPTEDDEIISASSGSGFAVSSDGYVITNHHVIDGCQKVLVHSKEKSVQAKVITYDPQNDLALLKADFKPETVFPLSADRPELLQDIYVAGYPFGKEISSSVKVTKGIISSLTGIGNNFSNIQIDAALQPGNSGGPILDEKGNLVGVAVAKLDAELILENFGSLPEDTNFGIKSNIVRNILDSNEVNGPQANQDEISKTKLGKMISSGTYYISCWMTMAQIEKMQSEKVMFSNLK